LLYQSKIVKNDGRIWVSFDTKPILTNVPKLEKTHLVRSTAWKHPHLRWNEMRGEYVSIAASRQHRPFLPPPEYCPLCISTNENFPTEVPSDFYRWASFENLFPGLSAQSENVTGYCEVVLYTQNHSSTLAQESLAQIEGLFYVWQNRSKEIGNMPGIEQVFLFENKGAEIGVTLSHPHGQIYAFNHVPLFLQQEHLSAKRWFQRTNECLVCELIQREINFSQRIICETETIIAYVPEAARYPYEVHITTKLHRPRIENLTMKECVECATVLKSILQKYDNLFGFSLPYILVHHQCDNSLEVEASYHWHIEIYPPHRSATKLKYLAGVESGTGFFINDTFPEEKAQELKNCEPVFSKNNIPYSYLFKDII
jgi:UDPglucose--hexose-1-phosphate uridylyltransferase